MTLTSLSAVVRRLIVSPGPAREQRTRSVVSAAGVSAVLRAFGRSPEALPVRTVVYLGGPATDPPPGPRHEGFTVRTVLTPGRALRLAHRELHAGTADFALVAGFGEPEQDTITVYAVKRAAEAVADSDPILGVLDVTGTDEDAPPPLRPLRHGHRATDPDRHRLLLWSGRDTDDETRVRGELLPLLDGLHSEAFPALPTAVPCGTRPGPVRAAAVSVSVLAVSSVHKARPVRADRPRPVALLFPGQGSQHPGMATGLYRREPVFTAAVDAVLAHHGRGGAPDPRRLAEPRRAAYPRRRRTAGATAAVRGRLRDRPPRPQLGCATRSRCSGTAPASSSPRPSPASCRCPTRSPCDGAAYGKP